MVAPSETASAPRHGNRSRGTLANSPLATQRLAVSHSWSGGNSFDCSSTVIIETPNVTRN